MNEMNEIEGEGDLKWRVLVGLNSGNGRTPRKTRKIPVWPTTNTPLESSGFEPETPVGTAARSSHATTGTSELRHSMK